jgi:hypothetical protein
MSFRIEKKYRVTRSEMHEIQHNLLSSGMKELHPPRIVNSYYFDTDTYTTFQESEEGILPRKKIRVRWYNDILDLTKEEKISSIEGRFKKKKKIGLFITKNEIININFLDTIYGNLNPVLEVCYERSYFKIGSLRVTFDKKIFYRNLKSITLPKFEDKECVIEVKVPINTNDSYIEKYFPFSTSRFSKYSRGILSFENIIKNF